VANGFFHTGVFLSCVVFREPFQFSLKAETGQDEQTGTAGWYDNLTQGAFFPEDIRQFCGNTAGASQAEAEAWGS
jgi:hypothetical protein